MLVVYWTLWWVRGLLVRYPITTRTIIDGAGNEEGYIDHPPYERHLSSNIKMSINRPKDCLDSVE